MPENMESANIMIVDDTPENLKLLDGMLRKQGYRVLSFPSGRLALQAAEKKPPNLILLDINMPEMNGYDVCERLKADDQLKEVPVIFISALNDTVNKVKAFTLGGVDYVTKPFQFEEVQARVHTHLELARARRALEELLSRTLTGSLRMLSEILATVNPDTFKLAGRLQRRMKSLVREIGLKSDWSFELAALFSNMALIATSPDLRNKYSMGTPLNAPEQKKVHRNIEFISELLDNIPAMEGVAKMIRYSKEPPQLPGNVNFCELDEALQGGLMLHGLEKCDQLLLSGHSIEEVMRFLRSMREIFPVQLLEALKAILWKEQGTIEQRCRIGHLRSGMVLKEDIIAMNGHKLLGQGAELSETYLKLLCQWREQLLIGDTVLVSTEQMKIVKQ